MGWCWLRWRGRRERGEGAAADLPRTCTVRSRGGLVRSSPCLAPSAGAGAKVPAGVGGSQRISAIFSAALRN